MCKNVLTAIVILFSVVHAQAASSSGRATMFVVRTDVQPTHVNIVKTRQTRATQKSGAQSTPVLIEVIY